MLSHQNNKGFGYLPVIAVSALVLTGLYFGYNWYNSQNSTNLKSDAPLEAAAPVSNDSEENSDVLAGNTGNSPTFNPENKPVRWSFLECEQYN